MTVVELAHQTGSQESLCLNYVVIGLDMEVRRSIYLAEYIRQQ